MTTHTDNREVVGRGGESVYMENTTRGGPVFPISESKSSHYLH